MWVITFLRKYALFIGIGCVSAGFTPWVSWIIIRQFFLRTIFALHCAHTARADQNGASSYVASTSPLPRARPHNATLRESLSSESGTTTSPSAPPSDLLNSTVPPTIPLGTAASPTPSVVGTCLRFLHIPKNAGTSIEQLWRKYSDKMHEHGDTALTWHKARGKIECSSPLDEDYCSVGGLANSDKCPRWHIPPHLDDRVRASYSSCTIFCIVRDPVDRLISEYFYRWGTCKKKQFKKWINHQIKVGATEPYRESCHMVPQSEYIWGPDGRSGNTTKFCHRVLRFETLDQDFKQLMDEYGLPVKMSKRKNTRDVSCKLLDEFASLAMPLVRKSYYQDVELLGYGRRNTRRLTYRIGGRSLRGQCQFRL